MLVELVATKAPATTAGAEIGVATGDTAALLLREFPALTLHMVDYWHAFESRSAYWKSGDRRARLPEHEHESRYQLARLATAFAGERAKLLRLMSTDAAMKVGDGTLDFVFIDASHAYAGVWLDLRAWYPKLKVGGLFCGHNYTNPRDQDGVRRAVNNFFMANRLGLHTAKEAIWWGLRK